MKDTKLFSFLMDKAEEKEVLLAMDTIFPFLKMCNLTRFKMFKWKYDFYSTHAENVFKMLISETWKTAEQRKLHSKL